MSLKSMPMKLSLVASMVVCARARLIIAKPPRLFDDLTTPEPPFGLESTAKPSRSDESAGEAAASDGTVFYGDTRCPCIGFDNVEGETKLEVMAWERSVEVSYPADLGARCEAWDDGRHPRCKADERPGQGNGWCAQQWCYVDPCKCDIDVLPKMAALYNTQATYRGKPLFWSYAACGGKDMFTHKVPKIGKPKCQCIGFAGVAGSTEITFADGSVGEYPADMGSSCKAWDSNTHPACRGDKAPSWCPSRWCYVDPCDCELPGDVVPKISAYLPEASFTGKNVYYSYETCGSADTWTEKNHVDACVNQATERDCGNHVRCAWTGSRCLGSELVLHPLCKAAARRISEMHSGSVVLVNSLVTSFLLVMGALAMADLM